LVEICGTLVGVLGVLIGSFYRGAFKRCKYWEVQFFEFIEGMGRRNGRWLIVESAWMPFSYLLVFSTDVFERERPMKMNIQL